MEEAAGRGEQGARVTRLAGRGGVVEAAGCIILRNLDGLEPL